MPRNTVLTSSNGTTFQSRSNYACYSGHVLRPGTGDTTQLSLVCSILLDKTVAWVSEVDVNETDWACERAVYYEGCFTQTGLTGISQVTSSTCQGHCRALNKPYALLRADECACAEAAMSESDVVDDAECSLDCVLDDESLCGGPDERWSVYNTFEGCFKKLDRAESFRTLNPVTCREWCRGQDSQYAAFGRLTCSCFTEIPQAAVRFHYNRLCSGPLWNESFTGDVVHLGQKVFGAWNGFYLGLYDAFSMSAHQWVDGSLLIYRLFGEGKPSHYENKCVATSNFMTHRLHWRDQDCVLSKQRIVCERSAGVYGCVEFEGDTTPDHTLVDEESMTLTLCLETCRGMGAMFAAASRDTCQCFTSLPLHSRVPWLECERRCPGNRGQICGERYNAFVLQDNTGAVGRWYQLHLPEQMGIVTAMASS
ncbi:uncharacterized protein LOC143290331 [Babylonia areolata]|uniref:uncharacterized protein LOC143290331 n=1 Tax=Babylonia areolata TaxID=304850 RepID=UPI003FD5876C